MQFCKTKRDELAKNWIAFEEQSGEALHIQDCHKAIRKALPQGLSSTETATKINSAPEVGINVQAESENE